MTRRPSMQFYCADFMGGTALMSAAARGAYITMLCTAWESGAIPDTRNALYKAMGLGPDDPPFDGLWNELKPKWKLTDSGWVNDKLEGVRADRDAFVASRSANGKLGGRPPKEKLRGTTSFRERKPSGSDSRNLVGKLHESSPTPTPTPICDLQSPSTTATAKGTNSARAVSCESDEDKAVKVLMAMAQSIGITLQRFLIVREFLPQASYHGDRADGMTFVTEFVEWACRSAAEQLKDGPIQDAAEPLKWWRSMWSLYPRYAAMPTESWHEECARLHGSACAKQLDHWHRMQDEAEARRVS